MNLKLLLVCFEITIYITTFLSIKDYCDDMNYSCEFGAFIISFLLNVVVLGLYLILSQIMQLVG